MKTPDSIIEIFSGTLWEAELIKGLLMNVEIESFLTNSYLNSYFYDPIYSTGVKVMIEAKNHETAKMIVDEYYFNLKTDLK